MRSSTPDSTGVSSSNLYAGKAMGRVKTPGSQPVIWLMPKKQSLTSIGDTQMHPRGYQLLFLQICHGTQGRCLLKYNLVGSELEMRMESEFSTEKGLSEVIANTPKSLLVALNFGMEG